MKLRRRARIMALQALFESDVAHHDAQRDGSDEVDDGNEDPAARRGIGSFLALALGGGG